MNLRTKAVLSITGLLLSLTACTTGGSLSGTVTCDPADAAGVTTCRATPAPTASQPATSAPATVPPTSSAPVTTAPATTPATTSPVTTAPTSPPATTTTPTQTVAPATWWKPTGGYTTQWQVQLSVANPAYINGVNFYVYDGFDASAAHVASLKSRGANSICYISAGTWEDWRPDRASFPAEVLGYNMEDWAGERYLDVRRLDILKPIMEKRVDLCKSKGFVAMDYDNVDTYSHGQATTKFPISATDQINYNKMLAEIAHSRGMAASLKNDVDQIAALEPFFDMAINESCFDYNECSAYRAFSNKGKPVINLQYSTLKCTEAKTLNIASMKKNVMLDAPRQPCT